MLMLRLGTWSQLLEFARVRYKKDYYILHHYFKIKCLRFIYTCICNQYPFQLHFFLLKLEKYDMHCAASPFSHLLNFFFFFFNFILKVAIFLCRVGEIHVSRIGGRENLSLTSFFFLVSCLLFFSLYWESFDTCLPSLLPFVICILLILQTEQSYSYLHFYFGILTSQTTKMLHYWQF